MSSCTNQPWGWSTWIDLYDCDPELIRSKVHIERFVIGLTDLLKVERYGDPVIVRFGKDPRVCGYSMVQLIETSLVSAHFIEESNTVCLDIFSCAEYRAATAVEYAAQHFAAGSHDYGIATRGARGGRQTRPMQPLRDPTDPEL